MTKEKNQALSIVIRETIKWLEKSDTGYGFVTFKFENFVPIFFEDKNTKRLTKQEE